MDSLHIVWFWFGFCVEGAAYFIPVVGWVLKVGGGREMDIGTLVEVGGSTLTLTRETRRSS